jgi:Protease subunit of ATP-dependent Clp proteases
MKNRKFWHWIKNDAGESDTADTPTVRTLYLNGVIAAESWLDDDVTPQLFKDELESVTGDIEVWLDSPGGDVMAATQIYNMLKNYKGKVTVKIDSLAASAASVVAMAGDEILMSPLSLMLIHNPLTVAAGNVDDMQKAIDMLDEVKQSIINAYELKTGLSRAKISHLMDCETWLSAKKAVELHFADGILFGKNEAEIDDESYAFSQREVSNNLINKLKTKSGVKISDLETRLNLLK